MKFIKLTVKCLFFVHKTSTLQVLFTVEWGGGKTRIISVSSRREKGRNLVESQTSLTDNKS